VLKHVPGEVRVVRDHDCLAPSHVAVARIVLLGGHVLQVLTQLIVNRVQLLTVFLVEQLLYGVLFLMCIEHEVEGGEQAASPESVAPSLA
jgi:hypothetical protein